MFGDKNYDFKAKYFTTTLSVEAGALPKVTVHVPLLTTLVNSSVPLGFDATRSTKRPLRNTKTSSKLDGTESDN